MAFGESDRAPSLHEQRAMESLGWTTSAQTGQGLLAPIWRLTSSQELLTETLLATFSLMVEGEGFLILEDTGLRFVMNGALVWMTRVDSPIRLQSVPPTEK